MKVSYVGTRAAAAVLGVSPSWVRHQYKVGLVDDSRVAPQRGTPHSISIEEMRVFFVVRDLLWEGNTYEQIMEHFERLTEGDSFSTKNHCFTVKLERATVIASARLLMKRAVQIEFGVGPHVEYSESYQSLQ